MEEVPLELLYKFVLPHLKWNDLLRLRRVCKKTKSVADAFIQESKIPVPDGVIIELNNDDKSLDSFLQLGYPVTQFFIDNRSTAQRFFKGEAAFQFRQDYAPNIVHLKVTKFSIFLTGDELLFYNSFKNLKSLEIEQVHMKFENLRPNSELPKLDIPKSLKTLTSLKITKAKRPCSTNDIYFSFLSTCKNLSEIAPASHKDHWKGLVNQFFNLSFYGLPRNSPRTLSKLEYLDLKYCPLARSPFDRQASKLSPYFLELCEQLVRNGIKMRNIPARLFNRFNLDDHDIQTVSNVVESLDGIHPVLLQIHLPHLKSLTIDTKLQVYSFFPAVTHPIFFQTYWPALQKIELLVDRKDFEKCRRQRQLYPKTPVTELFTLLFGGNVRPKLRTLRIYFYSRLSGSFSTDLSTYPCPRISEIICSCPKLVKLDITNWPDGNNFQFARLWGGLRLLEQVSLTKCTLLGDDGFIGEDESMPAFLQLKRLKKLVLGSLDRMPNITDKSFEIVFCHLNVTHFEISSKTPLENVTAKGILSLLCGQFSKSVEYFPFNNWSLSNMGKVRFAALADLFRSSHML